MEEYSEKIMEENEAAPHRVILLAGPVGLLLREVALALAAGGHSLILWESNIPHLENPQSEETTLALQLGIERAGGISLAVGAGGLAGAAEALGRIDAALASDLATAGRIAAATAGLERRLRPGRLLALRNDGDEWGELVGEQKGENIQTRINVLQNGDGLNQAIVAAPRGASLNEPTRSTKVDIITLSGSEADAPPPETVGRIAAFLAG